VKKLKSAIKYFIVWSAAASFPNAPLSANAAGYNALKQCYIAHTAMGGWFQKFSTDAKSVKYHQDQASRILSAASYEAPYLNLTAIQAKNDLEGASRRFILDSERRLGIGNARGLGELFQAEIAICTKWLNTQ
jgi:hypothetical protein